MSTDTTTIRDEVRDRYAAAARQVTAGRAGCCGAEADSGCCGPAAEATAASPEPGFYSETERAELPQLALAASLGCGNPLAVAELREGETVLDLGSGGGGDVLLSARRVGPTGRAYGLDMTDEMLALARRNAAEAGVSNVEFHKGHIEEIPLPDASVDVVISNCVINLSTDKPAVFAQMHRVLRPGGRVGVADIVADDSLTPDQRAASGDWASCAAGALSRSEYLAALTAAGFTDAEVTFLNQAPNGMHSAIVRATKP